MSTGQFLSDSAKDVSVPTEEEEEEEDFDEEAEEETRETEEAGISEEELTSPVTEDQHTQQ